MVYELKKYYSQADIEQKGEITKAVWETTKPMDDDNLKICGRLITYVGDDETAAIPDGVEVLARHFMTDPDWLSETEYVYIPASVVKIEEGAFAGTAVSELRIDPQSPCGIVRDGGLYTKDGKTLLWILESNSETEDGDEMFAVAEGTERLAEECFREDLIDVMYVPASVKEIGLDDTNLKNLFKTTIRAPRGAYALTFAAHFFIRHKITD